MDFLRALRFFVVDFLQERVADYFGSITAPINRIAPVFESRIAIRKGRSATKENRSLG